MKKYLLIVAALLLSVTTIGCGNKESIKVNMDNYQIILNVNANIDNDYISESVNIDLYSDKDYKITDYSNNEYIYKVDGKTYRQVMEQRLIEDERETSLDPRLEEDEVETDSSSEEETDVIKEITDYTKYSNPTLYLKVLDNIESKTKLEDKEMGIYVYTIYEIEVKKSIVNDILKDNNINYTLKNNVKGKVWVNKNEPDKVLQIILDASEDDNMISINTNFVNVGNISSIKEEIKDRIQG